MSQSRDGDHRAAPRPPGPAAPRVPAGEDGAPPQGGFVPGAPDAPAEAAPSRARPEPSAEGTGPAAAPRVSSGPGG
jgi:hypothetical protein